MSDYKAIAVIGVLVTEEQLLKPSKERECKHPLGKGKFCAECGKPMWVETKALVEKEKDGKMFGLSVFRPYDDREPQEFYFGSALASEYSNFVALPDIPSLKQEIKTALEPKGLWDEKKFGLYAILMYTG